jgi:hypothetical protein
LDCSCKRVSSPRACALLKRGTPRVLFGDPDTSFSHALVQVCHLLRALLHARLKRLDLFL